MKTDFKMDPYHDICIAIKDKDNLLAKNLLLELKIFENKELKSYFFNGVRYNNLEMVKFIVSLGFSIAENQIHCALIESIVDNKYDEMLLYLLDEDTPLTVAILKYCCSGSNSSIIKYIYEKYRLKNCRKLLEYICINERLDMMMYLIEDGWDLNNFTSIIHDIFLRKNVKFIELIISCLNSDNINHMLAYAIRYDNLPSVEILVKNGAVVDNKALIDAVYHCKFSILKYLIEVSGINFYDKDLTREICDIYETYSNRKGEIIDLLYENGFDFSGLSNSSFASLKYKNSKHLREIIETYIMDKAPIDITDLFIEMIKSMAYDVSSKDIFIKIMEIAHHHNLHDDVINEIVTALAIRKSSASFQYLKHIYEKYAVDEDKSLECIKNAIVIQNNDIVKYLLENKFVDYENLDQFYQEIYPKKWIK